MKKNIYFLLMALLVTMMSIGLSSCSKDDDDGGGGSGGSGSLDVNTLVGKTFYAEDMSYRDTGNSYCEIKFKTPYFVSVHKWGRNLDEYSKTGYSRWDYGWIDCMFDVKGNAITIHYTNYSFTEEIMLTFKNNVPVGYKLSDDEGNSGLNVDYGDAKSGTSDMFGFYVDKSYSTFMRDLKYIYFENLAAECDRWFGTGWLIIDGNTIGYTDSYVSLRQPSTNDTSVKTYHTENLYLGKKNYTLYFCYYVDPNNTYKYVVNGSNIMVSNGDVLTYSKNQLTDKTGYPFIKP